MEFAFDMTLSVALRLDAPDLESAKAIIRETMDSADSNFGAWPDGSPVLGEASLVALGDCYEIDGESVPIDATRAGFKSFSVARCAEWKDSHCDRIGWQSTFPDGEPQFVFWTIYGHLTGGGSQAVADLKTRASALCMADALAVGREVSCEDSALPGFRVTWETVTDASAEHGDAEERGFIHPAIGNWDTLDHAGKFDGSRYDMGLRDAVKYLFESSAGNLESVEANDSDPSGARWISTHYRTCDRDSDNVAESLSLHLPDSITPASRARLVRLLTKR